MKKERKELMKNFKNVIVDLLDHYEEYTDHERKEIQEVFQKVAELNKKLDKYDVDPKEKGNWVKYLETYNKYFGPSEY